KSEGWSAFWPQPLAASTATVSHCQIGRIRQNSADCLSFRAKPPVRLGPRNLNTMAEQRKTLEQREEMTDLDRLRHSASHVLATAILKIWPEAQFAAGPPVENGFYYDVDLPHRISPDDFEKIEAEMKNETKANHPFE